MSHNVQVNSTLKNTARLAVAEDFLDALYDQLDGGYLRIYAGSQPASATTALSGQTKLAEWSLPTPAFDAAASDSKALVALGTVQGVATGTAAWATLVKADGTTRVTDFTVGAVGSSSDLELDDTHIESGGDVVVSGLVIPAT